MLLATIGQPLDGLITRKDCFPLNGVKAISSMVATVLFSVISSIRVGVFGVYDSKNRFLTGRMSKGKDKAHKYSPRKTVPCSAGNSHEEQGANFAKLSTSPELSAYRIIDASEGHSGMRDNLDVPTLLQQLREQAIDANNGDMSRAEAMLMNQAVALQGLFTTLVENALSTGNPP